MKFVPALIIVITTVVCTGCSVHERWAYTAEARLGVSFGMTDSGNYRDDRAAGGMAEALLARRFHAPDRGGWIGAKRLCRCHPFGGHGFDPVPASPDHPITRSLGHQVDH